MRKALLLAATLGVALGVLAGCNNAETRVAERTLIQARLPDHCTFVELGEYGSLKLVVAVVCDGQATTTTNYSWTEQSGKSTVTRNGATVFLR